MAVTNCGESKRWGKGNILARGGGNMHFSIRTLGLGLWPSHTGRGRAASSGLGTNSFPAARRRGGGLNEIGQRRRHMG